MKVCILYQPESEHSRRIEEYAHDYLRQESNRKVELVSLKTREGSSLASLYDIVRYPAIVILDDDGRMLKYWQGEEEVPPLMSELAAYSYA